MREAREVFFIDGVRTPFGKAGPKGQYWRTRADDMGVKAVRELLRRNPEIPPERSGVGPLAAPPTGDPAGPDRRRHSRGDGAGRRPGADARQGRFAPRRHPRLRARLRG